jgi:hypothetical protein
MISPPQAVKIAEMTRVGKPEICHSSTVAMAGRDTSADDPTDVHDLES